MSDDDREVDIDSDDGGSGGPFADKRAHHNALERKRRDHIKESFSGLRDAIPTLHGDKSSRAQILKKASDYIGYMRKKNHTHQRDIDDLKRQNGHLEAQIRALERAKNAGQFDSAAEVLESQGLNYDPVPDRRAAAAMAMAGLKEEADEHLAGGSPENMENGYEASGSDNREPGLQHQQQHQHLPQPAQVVASSSPSSSSQQIHIQQVTTTTISSPHGQPQRRVIQVVQPGGPATAGVVRTGQSLLIANGQVQIAGAEPVIKRVKTDSPM